MDKIEYRAVIKVFVKEGLTPNEIHWKFINIYGDSSPSFSTTKKWAAEFKRGRTSFEDDPREGRPKSATTPEIIEQMHDMVLDDRRIKVREIAETIGISKERVRYILHEELHMKKLCARWVPRLLTADQKRIRMKISEQRLERFNKNKTELLEHPLYSPDLAPSDFHLFPKLKVFLAVQRFSSNQEAIAAVERYFADLTENHYRDGIMALEHRWNKCISLKGDYVEK
jgi:histone-lysine N-methyltransferase SETMAR